MAARRVRSLPDLGAVGDIPLVPLRQRGPSPGPGVAASEIGSTAAMLHPVAERSARPQWQQRLSQTLTKDIRELHASERELQDAMAIADGMSLDDLLAIMREVVKTHERDPNFPRVLLERFGEFLGNEEVKNNPEQWADRINEMKIEVALVTNNSPYANVRAVVPNTDDPSIPCSTIRSWIIGMLLSCVLSAINQLFAIRMPKIRIPTQVAQLFAYPLGKLCERVLPDRGFTLRGVRHSLNPGPFTYKEHMLITMMANVAIMGTYSGNLVWIQYLKQYLNQEWAGQFSYQILLALSTNFIGYGMAGLTRRFLVYPAYCMWPDSLATITMNTAFHTSDGSPVRGPWKTWTMTRYKFFMIAMGASFVWYWVPGYLIQPLSTFGWMAWINRDSLDLSAIAGFSGVGFNPFPTLDWNIASYFIDPFTCPLWATVVFFISMLLSSIVALGMWYHNAYYTGYIPIMTNLVYDNKGNGYNVARVIDDKRGFVTDKYESYSEVYLGAAQLVAYFCFFAMYPATLMNAWLDNRYAVIIAFQRLYRLFKKDSIKKSPPCIDAHSRLMAKYAEVPEAWFLVVLGLSVAAGVCALYFWDTDTTPLVVLYGIVLCAIFVVPLGIMKAITTFEVTLNVLAEFLGGYFVHGDMLALNFFKAFGYVTCAHAISFASELKLGHYVKIPPRQTFCAQIIASLASTFICIGIQNFQMKNIENVCTPHATDKMTCPGVNTFFSSSVVWGTIGPQRMFSVTGQYPQILLGWLVGFIVPLIIHNARKLYPRLKWMAKFNTIAIFSGGASWVPYNLSYIWPVVPMAFISWAYVNKRWSGFWDRYNYVLSAALTTGVGLATVVIFFALDWHREAIGFYWWGTNSTLEDLENVNPRWVIPKAGEYFGDRIGDFH